MGFSLATFLEKALGGFSVPDIDAKVQAWLNEKAEQYPDLGDRMAALADFLKETLTEAEPELDPMTMVGTIRGIAADIVKGTAGVDHGAWQGGG